MISKVESRLIPLDLIFLWHYTFTVLYVFHGSDTHVAITKASSLVNSLRAKKPDASYVRVEAGNWASSIIEEHLGGQGLFSNKYIIFLDRVTENSDAKEVLPTFVSAMNESQNIFVVVEGKINTELKKAFDKSAEKVVECEKDSIVAGKKVSGVKDEFNIFALADAVGQRDAFKAWSIYRQAIDSGIEVESIVGTIFWQIKSIILAKTSSTAGEAGLNPFVFGKTKRYSVNFSAEELDRWSKNIITLYHDGHRGKVDLELAMERFLLSNVSK